MLDIAYIRADPEAAKARLSRKGAEYAVELDQILEIDLRRRDALVEVEAKKARRNQASQEVARLKREGKEATQLIEETRALGDEIRALDANVAVLEDLLRERLLLLPNYPADEVLSGIGEEENREIEGMRWGEPPAFDFEPRHHSDIGLDLGIFDFERGAKIFGSRGYVTMGAGSLLQRALISFMCDVHTREHGYIEISPPYMVRRECMVGTGQLPKFEDDAYRIDSDDLFLIPTAEVPVTNFFRDEILDGDRLPINFVAYTACFRREAGAAGRDTKGIIRVHQFDKVEMVKFTKPEESSAEFEKLVRNALNILEYLKLPYRVVEMCAGDLGFTAAKKWDPEVWMPGQGRYVEVSSCSNFTDFQARRANIRFRREPGAKPEFVHTLNGSGLAVGRTLAAILENYQQADGSVKLPEALLPYTGGITEIR